MTPGRISRLVVADKIALVRRMQDGIATLPLDDLTTFTADPRLGDLQRVIAGVTDWLSRHADRVADLD